MALKANGEFLEHAYVHGNWYATSATWLADGGRTRPRRAARDRLAGRAAGAPADPRGGPHLHPAAVARLAARAARKARAGLAGGHRAAAGRRARRNAALRRVRLCYYESGLCEGRRRSVRDRARRPPGRAAAAGAPCALHRRSCLQTESTDREDRHGPHHDRRLPRQDSQPLRADARRDQPRPADHAPASRRWSTPTATSRPSSRCAKSPPARSASKCC